MMAHSTVVDIHTLLASRGGSTVVYLVCITANALQELRRMLASDRVKAALARIVDHVTHAPNPAQVFATDDDFDVGLSQEKCSIVDLFEARLHDPSPGLCNSES